MQNLLGRRSQAQSITPIDVPGTQKSQRESIVVGSLETLEDSSNGDKEPIFDMLEPLIFQKFIDLVDTESEQYFNDMVIEKTISNKCYTVRVNQINSAKFILDKGLILIYNVSTAL